MQRRNINQLGHQESVDQVFLASQKQLRPNRNGNLYLQVELSDRSGSLARGCGMPARPTIADSRTAISSASKGRRKSIKAALQMIATSICKARPEEIELADFMTLSPAEIDQLAVRLGRAARAAWAIRICGIWPNAFWPTKISWTASAARRPA